MLGAIAGDIIGSRFERGGKKEMEFPLFHPDCRLTDDTVMTIAIADSLINNRSYAETMMEWGSRYPDTGYGGNFRKWLEGSIKGPYNSFGNGSAMRVSPCGYLADEIQVLRAAEESAIPTHNHPEGVKGAQSVALAIFLARQGRSKVEIKNEITSRFNYNLDFSIAELRPFYSFDVTCQGSVPESIVCFLEGKDFEETIRLAISMGGDTDTMAAIAGSIAEVYYGGIPTGIEEEVLNRLPKEMKDVLLVFRKKYGPKQER